MNKKDVQGNFNKYTNFQTFETPYDYRSIMHYNEYAFSNNGQKTIVPLQAGITLVPAFRKTDEQILTATDVLGIKRLYQCNIMPTTNPISKPVTNPVTKPVTSPLTKPFTKPVTDPVTKPVTKPVTNPVTLPTIRPQLFSFILTNDLGKYVRMYWVSYSGRLVYYGTLYPGRSYRQYTYVGHKWKLKIHRQKNKKFEIGKDQFTKSNQRYFISKI